MTFKLVLSLLVAALFIKLGSHQEMRAAEGIPLLQYSSS